MPFDAGKNSGWLFGAETHPRINPKPSGEQT
jgi:hypothetical protein